MTGRLAFSRGHNIWVLSGSGMEQATNVGGAENPAWSPDGNQLAFDRLGKNSANLYVMAYPGGSPRAITRNDSAVVDNNFWDMQPDWSPDGTSLIEVSDRGRVQSGTLDLAAWRLTLATGARSQLSGANLYTGGVDRPRWRPSSPSQILFTSWTYEPNTTEAYGQLTLLDLNRHVSRPLTPSGESALEASWSPDGRYVAFVRRLNGKDPVWVMPVDQPVATSGSTSGTPPAEPPSLDSTAWPLVDGTCAQPAWSPAGDAISYIALKDGSFDLFLQRLTPDLRASGAPIRLTRGLHVDADSSLAWAPSSSAGARQGTLSDSPR